MKIVRLAPEHITAVQLQSAQGYAAPLINPEHAHQITDAKGIGWAAVSDDQVIACAGIIEMHPERGMAWAMLSDSALRQFRLIHRTVSAVVNAAPWRRIEMTVDAQHQEAISWAERLGFECEGLMRAYTPDGRDCFLYAKVK